MTPPYGPFVVRQASVQDAATLTTPRAALFREIGQTVTPEEQASFERLTKLAFAAGLKDGFCLAWLARSENGESIGSVALLLFPRLPTPLAPAQGEGYLLNVYIRPEWRGRGVATALVETAVGRGRELGLAPIRLHTTAAGRAVYPSAGFVSRDNELEPRLQG